MLIEVVQVHASLSRLRLQPCPAPRMPAKCSVPRQVARGLLCLGRLSAWISREQLVSKWAVALAHTLHVSALRRRNCETCALIGVVSDQDRNIVVPPRLIQPELILRDDPPIRHGP